MIEGGCVCGKVRYRATGNPLWGSFCHCRECQRFSGAGHLPVMGVDGAGFSVQGEPRRFTLAGGSGKPATRWFCGDCGSLLYGETEAIAGLIIVYVGSLDDPSIFKPQARLNIKHRHAWDAVDDLPAFHGMPPG